MTPIKLGDVARDSITGLEGVVVCIAKWLHGCERVTLQPQKLHDGRIVEMSTFDMPQLQLVSAKVAATTDGTGGPRPEPQRAFAPR